MQNYSWRRVLMPLSWLFGSIVWVRNKMFDRQWLPSVQFDVPVVVVGNITVGGTGKTPHTDYLATLLKQRQKIAILSRGYGRVTKGFRYVTDAESSLTVGDEPFLLFKRHPDVVVAVCESRVTGIKTILEQHPDIKTVLLDDAFQHRHVKALHNIVLVDFTRPIYNDYLLPAGNLREPRKNLKRAQTIVVTKTPDNILPETRDEIKRKLHVSPAQSVYFSTLRYGVLQNIFTPTQKIDVNALSKDYGIVLVTGIANPKPLVSYLNQFTTHIHHFAYSDHHTFTTSDWDKVQHFFSDLKPDKKLIITTEKDAVRLLLLKNTTDVTKKHLYYIPLHIEIINEQETFNRNIIDLCCKK